MSVKSEKIGQKIWKKRVRFLMGFISKPKEEAREINKKKQKEITVDSATFNFIFISSTFSIIIALYILTLWVHYGESNLPFLL